MLAPKEDGLETSPYWTGLLARICLATGLVLGAVDAVAAVYVLAHPQWLGHMVACLCLSGILAVLVTPRLAVVTGRRPINFAASLFMLAGACIGMVTRTWPA